jgi:cellulose synthase/poly-beta-1,6-N-acetylglucosamine synthase-like glycosyltransferase
MEKFLTRPLGELLCQRRVITPAHLADALVAQKKSGSRIGDILIGMGCTGYRPLYETLAHKQGLPFADLLQTPPDASLLTTKNPENFLKYKAIPWRREGSDVVVAVCELSAEVSAWIRQHYGEKARIVMTSPFDIRRVVEQHFGTLLEQKSRLLLWKKQPHASARITLPPRQQQIAIGMALMALAAIIVWPVQMALNFIIFCHVAYGATMLFKYLVFAAGQHAIRPQDDAFALDEQSLPVYTVLVPMYKETESLPGMLDALKKLDYPASKLDIKLVLESDDQETLRAAHALKPSYHFDIIRVPPSQPRTKPKACNYALRFARGAYVTIFDADDRPERTQLKKAVAAFQTLPKDVVCLQARLNYYNANDNLLTRFFSLEYTILFHFMLYGLERLGIPIPLGGTSNHIDLARLKELGEWDPYNVTEDADLGLRLAARGFKTRMLNSYTMEEAPNRIHPWIKQRSRWIKGYMQTWLVHMRDPRTLWKKMGWRGFLGFQFFVGLSCFTFLTAPLVWIVSLLWVGGVADIHGVPFPTWLVVLTLTNLALNLVTHWYLSIYCARLYRKYRPAMLIAGFFYPLYLILHSLASYKALWQLAINPHFWEKTAHGLARQTDSLMLEQDIVKIRHKSR